MVSKYYLIIYFVNYTTFFTGGGTDVLADSINEILQPEDVEKLETALQSEHAKAILGDVLGNIFIDFNISYLLR